jgi:Concanavalin A-like lectin/glucanases superfamily/F5/8 type C domain
MANLSPVVNVQLFDLKGKLLFGGKIETYEAGTTDLISTYGDADGTILQSNPIILNDYGMPENPIWLTNGVSYKFIIYDAEDNLLWTYDNINGVNDPIDLGAYYANQWIESEVPNYTSENSFYLIGDHTKRLHKFRRIKIAMIGGDVYGSILKSEYDLATDKTNITVLLDGSEVLTEDLILLYYGILSYEPQSYPNFLPMAQWQKRGDDLTLTGGKVETWDITGNFAHVTGTGDVADLGVAYQEGSVKYLMFDDIGVVIKNNAKIKTPKGIDLALVAGDVIQVIGGKDGVNLVAHLMSNKPDVLPTWTAPLQVRQTVLTGPASIQIGSSSTAPYYQLPQEPMTANISNGWEVQATAHWNANNADNFHAFGAGGQSYLEGNPITLIFPEIYYINSFSMNNFSVFGGACDQVIVHYSIDGSTYKELMNVRVNRDGWTTFNFGMIECKYFRVYPYVDNGDWSACTIDVIQPLGYKKIDVPIQTVSAINEVLVKNIAYTKKSPILTSSNENGYIVSASTEGGTNYGWKAFSGNTTSYWEASSNANEWLRMQFPLAVAIGRLILTSPSTLPTQMPVSFRVEGSQDGTAWTILGSWVDGPLWIVNESKRYDFNNTTEYLYYRVFVISNGGGSKIAIGECSFDNLTTGNEFGTSTLNLSEEQSVISFANGFGIDGQVDYTVGLPKDNKTVDILPAAINYVYIARDAISGQITYEAKQFSPIYGNYQPKFKQDIPTLLRGDGTSGTSTIVDAYGNDGITLTGTITNSSTLKKFGAGSILFGSAGSVLKIPKNFGVSRERWTIDFWWNPTTLTGNIDLINTTPSFSAMLAWGRTASKLSLYLSSNGSTWDIASNIAGTKANFAINTWYYIKVVFLGRRYMVFVDGVKDIEISNTALIKQITSINVGAYNGEASTACGFIDEWRFRPGMGDYYASTTPILPTEAPVYQKPWYFNINDMIGYEKEEDGTYTVVQKICCGEAITREITSYDATVTTYAYNGRKSIAWTTFNPITDDWLTLPHNMGTDLITPDILINGQSAASPYDQESLLPIDGVGMVSGANAFSGVPMARVIDAKNFKIRYPAESSADYVGAYAGSGSVVSITGGAINISGVFTRAF